MIRLCLFDLDQTLVDTDDISELRQAGARRNDATYEGEIRRAIRRRSRTIIGEDVIAELRRRIPGLKLGIFTRSPRRYVDVMLTEAFRNTSWDVVIAYEDVDRGCWKPNGQGILRAMTALGLDPKRDLPDVLLVGDNDVDLRSAYHAGCRTALFKKAWPRWPRRLDSCHWNAKDLMADVVIKEPSQLVQSLTGMASRLPDLECLLDGVTPDGSPRFDAIGHFFPGSKTPTLVHVAGRYFADRSNLDSRRSWHSLNESIYAHKDATTFAADWIEAVRRYLAEHYKYLTANPVGDGPEVVITAIPARPGRIHRLGYLIRQLEGTYDQPPRLNRLRLTFAPDVLSYRDGVKSQSHDRLSKEQRFANVRDHLYVSNPNAISGKKVLVIDDVSTSGATLLYAKKYLMDEGARSVDCFSIAQTISDPLRYQ